MADGNSKVMIDFTRARSRRAPDIVRPGPPVRVRVLLYFERIDGPQPKNADAEQPQELEAGARYIVQVTLRRSDHPNAVEIGEGHQIRLEWQGADQKPTVHGHADPVSSTSLASHGYVAEFTLDIPKHTPVSEGELLVTGIGFGAESETLRRRKIKIIGHLHAVPGEILKYVKLALQPESKTELAVLHIGESKAGLDIIGYHPSKPFSGSFEKLPASLADVDSEMPSRKVYKAVNAYSQGALRDLLAWLDEVLKQTGERVSIVIMERTDSRVPWEMLVLENQTPPLGARVPVTRWTDVTLYKDTIPLDPLASLEHRGSVLHYVDRTGLAQAKIEVDELLECENVNCKDLLDLQHRLNAPPEDMAALFLSCHGTFAQDEDHSAELAAAKVAGSGIKALDLVELTTPARRPAIIVNACHSARVVRSIYGWSGLPNFFLAKYASCYLGTLGAVDETFAAELGRDLIKAAREKGVNLSEFLFEIRRNAWQKFVTTPLPNRNYWALVSAFMYVLYGPVENRMQLLPRKAHG